MTDYVFKYTNNPSASFVLKPYTANGPMSPSVTTPYVNASTGIHAIAMNTPFVFVGKGVTDYGQLVQNNIIYLAENFCNVTRPIPPMKGMLWYKNADGVDAAYPSDPTVAGMYVWDGTTWNSLLINGKIVAPVNAGGNRITNVGDAVVDTDALNANAANARYLQLTGGTLSGNLIFSTTSTAKISLAPVANEDVANKLYVDSADANIQNTIDVVNTTLSGDIASINTQLTTLYPQTGGTVSGDVTIAGNLTVAGSGNVTFASGSGTLNLSDRVVSNVGSPVLAHDAVHKDYVDTTIAAAIANISVPSGGTSDGVVSSGYLDAATGVLTLSRTMGLPPITVAGTFASFTHSHNALTVTFDPTQNIRRGEIAVTPGTLITNVNDALVFFDRAIAGLNATPMRTVVQQTVPGNVTFSLGDRYTFRIWSDRLMVHVNGIKQYCDTRSETSIDVTNAGVNVLVGIPAQTYTQTITVDGVPHSISITITAASTYWTMYQDIVAALTAGGVPAHCALTQGYANLLFTFVSDASGAGHTVTLSTTSTHLFPSIPTAGAQVTEVGQTLSYYENGFAGDETDTIVFHAAPPTNALIEATIISSGLD